jgi:ribosomal 30S subunit maturation factor RimM
MMKKAFFVATIVLAVSGVGLAQTPSTTTLPLKPAVSTMTQEFRASKILGANVKNIAGETIGEVKDLVLLRDNEVLQAIVSVGGFLGIGDTLVTIPYDKLKVQRVDDDVQVMYNATKAELEGMPKFLDTTEARAQLTLRARDLIGANVKNANDDTIGEIDDLMVTAAQAIPQAIVSMGGFLEMGERLVAIPFDALVIRRVDDKEHVTYNATAEVLKAMPAFKHN